MTSLLIGLIGTNGSGKTNFLESISLLEPGKGFRKNSLDKMKKFKQNSPWIIRYKYNDNNKLTKNEIIKFIMIKEEEEINKFI